MRKHFCPHRRLSFRQPFNHVRLWAGLMSAVSLGTSGANLMPIDRGESGEFSFDRIGAEVAATAATIVTRGLGDDQGYFHRVPQSDQPVTEFCSAIKGFDLVL